jgi:hypothetical protein
VRLGLADSMPGLVAAHLVFVLATSPTGNLVGGVEMAQAPRLLDADEVMRTGASPDRP